MASRARQRPPRIQVPSNDTHEQQLLPTRIQVRRNVHSRRKRVPATVVTCASFLLVGFIILVRRILVVLPSHHYELPKHVLGNDKSESTSRPILTAFLEPPNTLDTRTRPLPPRNTSATILSRVQYPQVQKCSQMMETWPVDDFPSEDPYLPWIHDVFPSRDGSRIQIVAQNKRRCHVGEEQQEEMKYWEPQISLLQPVPVLKQENEEYRLSSFEQATWNETRFLCQFHTATGKEYTTFSKYPFNYEYVSWRKNFNSMYQTSGKDNQQFWLSQLLFFCPVPVELQKEIQSESHVINDETSLWMDIVPIRTPARNGQSIFTKNHVRPDLLKYLNMFDAKQEWGEQHVLPAVQDSGRWANIPICLPPQISQQRHRLVACTWTAASYTRRGDAVGVDDTAHRLREWLLFHEMVGFEQVYVYDNTEGSKSQLYDICAEFKICVYHKWPAAVCNNNRPNHPNPGERSSQYAAEASCRERYGPSADWMAFIDTDEYLVPMKSDTWKDVLEEMDANGIKILKMKSSRAKPRLNLMEEQTDKTTCVDPASRTSRFKPESCVVPRSNETFLRTYNCEYIKPPRPNRFQRAMKQIYRPSHVWNHFVHYSTVTADIARLYKDYTPGDTYVATVHSQEWQRSSPEIFLDELTQGILVHAKTVLPRETMYRSSICRLNSTLPCSLGFECPAHVEFSDRLHTKNLFQDDDGKYCNCWTNPKIEEVLAPKLKIALEEHRRKVAAATGR